MPRRCTICVHERRHEIDRALVGTDSYRIIAQRFSVSRDAIACHRRHLVDENDNRLNTTETFESSAVVEQLRFAQQIMDDLALPGLLLFRGERPVDSYITHGLPLFESGRWCAWPSGVTGGSKLERVLMLRHMVKAPARIIAWSGRRCERAG